MKKITLQTNPKTKTEIFIGANIQQEINAFINKLNPSKTVYITDENLVDKLKNYLKVEEENIFILKSGESEKNLTNLTNIIQFYLKKNIDRKSIIVAFGGGVISDITGFTASIFYRGVPLILIPTTLLAQVDAAVGGKNTINYENIKNVLGTFYQPKAVFCDTALLESLSQKEFETGIAEVIKYGAGFDKELFNILTTLDRDNTSQLFEIITKSIAIKANIVEKDTDETKQLRKLLNLGHTLGHALESESKLELTHGQGVAIGLHFACFVAHQLGNTSKEELNDILSVINKYNLPIYVEFDVDQIIKKISYDKKKEKEFIDFITLKKIGQAYIHKMKINELEKYLNKFKS